MQFTTMRLAVLVAGSLLLPVGGFCASQPVSPILMPFNHTLDETAAPSGTAADTPHELPHIIQGRVVSAVTGAHDTEGVLHIQPVASHTSALEISVPNNTSIQRSDEVEKVSGETGIAFFRHIQVGDMVVIAYDRAQDTSDSATEYVADKIEIVHRG